MFQQVQVVWICLFLSISFGLLFGHSHVRTGNWKDDIAKAGYELKCKMQPNSYDCSPGKNKTSLPRYYYDLKMEACLTFDYYECDLSLNNFVYLFECNDYCHVVGKEQISTTNPNIYCRLQPDFGECNSYHPMFYYDITTRSCTGFSYSGCGGNRNRFSNAKKCMAICSPVLDAMDIV